MAWCLRALPRRHRLAGRRGPFCHTQAIRTVWRKAPAWSAWHVLHDTSVHEDVESLTLLTVHAEGRPNIGCVHRPSRIGARSCMTSRPWRRPSQTRDRLRPRSGGTAAGLGAACAGVCLRKGDSGTDIAKRAGMVLRWSDAIGTCGRLDGHDPPCGNSQPDLDYWLGYPRH